MLQIPISNEDEANKETVAPATVAPPNDKTPQISPFQQDPGELLDPLAPSGATEPTEKQTLPKSQLRFGASFNAMILDSQKEQPNGIINTEIINTAHFKETKNEDENNENPVSKTISQIDVVNEKMDEEELDDMLLKNQGWVDPLEGE